MMNDLFLRACRKESVERTPVWYMRQAGRYQPEYRKIREKYSLLEICERPDVCAQVTTLPITQLGVDAAILFSDIMVPVGAMGLDFDLKKDVGPMIEHPITSLADVYIPLLTFCCTNFSNSGVKEIFISTSRLLCLSYNKL